MALTTFEKEIINTANNKRGNLQVSSKIKREECKRNLFTWTISTEYVAHERVSNRKYNKLKSHHHKKYLY